MQDAAQALADAGFLLNNPETGCFFILPDFARLNCPVSKKIAICVGCQKGHAAITQFYTMTRMENEHASIHLRRCVQIDAIAM